MENEDIQSSFGGIFYGKTVLVTGHTGFKGSWISIWLRELGAKVIGYSLEPPTEENNFEAARLKERLVDIREDVRNLDRLKEVIEKYKPEIIFHLAAQPIVLTSFDYPKETFDINLGGTVNVLEAARQSNSVKIIICITSDKCYKNKELIWGYREEDEVGGKDPYSCSKSLAELAIASYRWSFFRGPNPKIAVSSVRAGNVIGGGDFAKFRLVPDCMKALITKKPVEVRNTNSVRPWQHVLVPLSGYLLLAYNMLKDKENYNGAWNFGPKEIKGISAKEIVEKAIEFWGEGEWKNLFENSKKETGLLKLNWEKASHFLSWYPFYDWQESLSETVNWFKEYNKEKDMYNFCVNQIKRYTQKARLSGANWA